jgi:hypothetical protein
VAVTPAERAWASCPPGGAATLRISVAASHGVLAPVLVVALAVVPLLVSTRSCARNSMSLVGETLVRTV